MLNHRFSIYLDLVRFSAAVIVLLSHFAYERFSGGNYMILREFNLGSDAVVLFFVLSGFVIAYAAEQKDKLARTYFFNRATRLFSVIIPALALTYVLDTSGNFINPDIYAGWWYNQVSVWQFFLQGLTFSNEWAGMEVRLGTNGPYWSISYEVAYYVLFGVAIFISGILRILLLFCLCVLFGLNILLLLPVWLMGVFCYKTLKVFNVEGSQPTSNLVLWVGAVVPLLLYVLALSFDIPGKLSTFMGSVVGADPNLLFRFSDEFIWNSLIGFGFALHLFCMGLLMQSAQTKSPQLGINSWIKWLAGASFSLYLVHYPLLQFLLAVLPKTGIEMFDHLLLLSLTIGLCFGFAQIFERNLADFRAMCARFGGTQRSITVR